MKKLVFIFLGILPILISCNSDKCTEIEKNKEVVKQFIEIVNTRDYDRLEDVMTEGFIRHSQATPDANIRSRDEMKQFMEADLKVVPDQQFDFELLLGEGDLVAGLFSYTGTQEGAMGPFPATGKRINLNYLSILRIEEGKIAEMWIEWDNMAILNQLGHFPSQPPMDVE